MGVSIRVADDQRVAILKDVGYNEESLKEDTERLRLWIKGQPHLPQSARQEPDCFLQTFLLGCKGNLEICKKKIDKYYSCRHNMLNFIFPLDPCEASVLATQPHSLLATLPELTPAGHGVTIASLSCPLPDLDVLGCTKRLFMTIELRGRMESQASGEWVVIDAKNLTLSHVYAAPPNIVKDVVQYVQDVAPVRIKGIIYINAPSFVETTINIFVKPLLNKKLANRIFIYTDELSLQNHFPKEMLPKDYGGDAPTLKELSDFWFEECKSKRDFFTGPLSEKCDERKRLDDGNATYIHGTFRQLAID